MSDRLKGKVAIITGGASGLGETIARTFHKEGATVVIADIDKELGQKLAQEITGDGGRAAFIPTDVSKQNEIKNLVDKTIELYGKLDCAVNNTGIFHRFALTHELDEEIWDNIMAVNLRGLWLCMKYEVPQILKQGGGAIVNMSSAAGLVGMRGFVAYSASKGGVIQLTKTAALDYAKSGISVNAVCPGTIKTLKVAKALEDPEEKAEIQSVIDSHPIGRLGYPEEVAEAVLFFCSQKTRFITGVCLPVDGGSTAA